jgi:hypothetical protein
VGALYAEPATIFPTIIQMIELWTLDLIHWVMAGESWTVRTLPQGGGAPRRNHDVFDMRFALSETMITKSFVYMNSMPFTPT